VLKTISQDISPVENNFLNSSGESSGLCALGLCKWGE